jgi:hypothetical protein
MGRVLRFVVAALVIWACWHAGAAQWQNFRFGDAVQQVAQFGVDKDEDTIRASVFTEAARLGIVLRPDAVAVRRSSDHLYIDVAYTQAIEILPRYRYPWTFTARGDGWFVPGGQIRK